jgi:hypothetical protein
LYAVLVAAVWTFGSSIEVETWWIRIHDTTLFHIFDSINRMVYATKIL